MKVLLFLFCMFSGSGLADQPAAARLDARVVGVADGDTVTVVLSGVERKVRLEDIDAPELGQPYGRNARSALSALVFGKTVVLRPSGADQYGRLVARVWVAGQDVGLALVAEGLAWESGGSRHADLVSADQRAREARRGLWSDNRPTPPWVFRREARGSGRASAKPGGGAGAASAADSGPYHGNARSLVYHGPGCRDYNCKNCTVVFESREAAEKAGFRPHAACVRRDF